MLELNSKPKKLVVQRHTKANKWLTEAVMTKDEILTVDNVNGEIENVYPSRSWTNDEVYYLLETFKFWAEDNGDMETNSIRILNEHGKVILSTASHDFLIAAGRSGHITVKEPVFDEDGNEVGHTMACYSAVNSAYTHIREFQKLIGRHKGISHVTKYPRDENDGWERIWKVHFKDGAHVTVGTHQLYKLNNMIVSHFHDD